MIIYILLAIVIFGFLIFIHELGHYLTARIFDVHIKEFAIGMGPKLFSHTSKKTEIIYSVRILPFGGYVAMAGEEYDDEDDDRALCNKEVWKRIIITFAGSFMNIILGIILTVIMVISQPRIGDTEIVSFDESAVSQTYGLMSGDIITKIGKTDVSTANDVSYEVAHSGTEALDITVLRNGKEIVIPGVKFGIESEEGVAFGNMDFNLKSVPKTIKNVVKHSYCNIKLSVRMIWESLFDLITGRYSFDSLSGPVGLTSTMSDVARRSYVSFIYLCSVIAMNLGIFNLLPIPALDGGRIFFQLYELIFRRPINRKAESAIHFVGIIVLFGFMLLITFKDIFKLLR